jgi:hypothetical protein
MNNKMKKTNYLKLSACLLALTLVSLNKASGQNGGLEMLGIGPEPISLSLSEAVTARDLSGASIFTNPANLALKKDYSITASHTFWLENSTNSHLSLLLPTSRGSFGLGVLTSSIREIEARSVPGDPSGTFDVSYYAFAGSYARDLKYFNVGITAMYLYEQLYELSASGYAFNLGASKTFLNNNIRVGAAVLNLGQMDYLAEARSPLPTVFKAGVWSQLLQVSAVGSSEIPLIVSISADVNVPINDGKEGSMSGGQTDPWISSGLEITISDLISIRGGYQSGETKRNFSTGLGLQFGSASFNYAFVPFETGFGNTHSLSLVYFFK